MSNAIVYMPYDREIIVYAKRDGNMSDQHHHIHQSYASVQQTHENRIWKYDSNMPLVGKQPINADAIYTWGGAVGIYVADCLPVVMVSEQMSALVHCSWKTLHQGLLHAVVDEFIAQKLPPIAVRCGPCIKHYEVGKEFVDYFPATFLTPYGETYLFDLVGYVVAQIDSFGIDPAITIDSGCTRHDTQTYRSYRRGNQGAHNFVGLRKNPT